MNVNQEIMKVLKDVGVPVSFLVCKKEPKPPMYITFFEIVAAESDHVDDVAKREEVNVQIDVWATLGESITVLRENVINKMKLNGWNCRRGPDFYEQGTNTYHKVLEFKKETELI